MSKFEKEYRISLRDMTIGFRTKTTTLLHDFEECFAQLCMKHHITGFDLDKQGLMWVIANINLEIIDDLPIWDNTLKIEIWFSEIKKLRAFLDFKIYYKETLIAQGDSLWFVLDQKTRKPVIIDRIIEFCDKSEELVFNSHKKISINKDEMLKICENEYTVNFNDLDYNGHVNNVSYVDWAIMTIPEEYMKQNKIKKYSINFAQECFLNEKLITNLYQTDNKFHFEIIKKDGTTVCNVDIEAEKL